ncbi:hypothetical protein FOB44_18775 [Chryseobacterium gallinarum]|uniref:Uncharacterized protein n=1 Tax=Chryseobacterium gallinarum TaxID=1324352 RepID=A0ABX6KW66_CHRGL|nr:hypothetical protein FOB44_18775 [Chryseobacterium gallinarum]
MPMILTRWLMKPWHSRFQILYGVNMDLMQEPSISITISRKVLNSSTSWTGRLMINTPYRLKTIWYFHRLPILRGMVPTSDSQVWISCRKILPLQRLLS